ncbi:GIY-YIG nuclease family protein (plasmid) [Nostoc sp. UHCC 0926]|uniref:GIY-YIG nuclease family protein n=1 Tax=Nostoc sp. UHCC 0926 TaxID=3025190 RepID=UPI00235F0DFC|nr:GIY-YIG nuclease family protein [Nostoc sp. UHCC 0926]WDD30130.1 GIY-YIG nuclease family protein [Nostoc sp. UHCC 0926]
MTVEAVNPLTLPSPSPQQAETASPSVKSGFAKMMRETLWSLPLADRRKLPKYAGIYFVINTNNELLYIGLSKTNLAKRWRNHHQLHHLTTMGDGIYIVWAKFDDITALVKLESGLIKFFQPILNRLPASGDKVTVSVIVTKEVHGKLKQLANSKRWSVSQTGAVLIEEGLDRADQENSAPNQHQGAA